MQKRNKKTCRKTPTLTVFSLPLFKFLLENRNAVLFSDKDVLHKHQDAAFSYTAESFLKKSNVEELITMENMATIFSGEKI